MTDFVTIAREVLLTEIAGMHAFEQALGAEFDSLCRLVAAVRGRLIVTGMGKSGHVARKIAATLSSTGTPASFVHPAEASHGDLGMITPSDGVLALSKSGETTELRDLLAYAKRFTIPLGAITCEAESTLARAADAPLVLPNAREACDETGAPTTSTTLMMAAGDALAVSLLKAKGFSASDFRGFHPGGKLGAQLQRVSDLMHRDLELPLCSPQTKVALAVAQQSAAGFGCVGIIDDDRRLIGVLTDGDIRRLFGKNVVDEPVDAVMTRTPKTVHPDTLVGEALALLNAGRITALFVVDDDSRAIGLLHVHDCLRTGVA